MNRKLNYHIEILPQSFGTFTDEFHYPGVTLSHSQSEIYIAVSTDRDWHNVRNAFYANFLNMEICSAYSVCSTNLFLSQIPIAIHEHLLNFSSFLNLLLRLKYKVLT